MKIYTKFGDKGTTRIGNGSDLKKDDPLIEALGSIDELNAFIGYAISISHTNKKRLEKIQSELFYIGAEVSLSKSKYDFSVGIERLEKEIDLLQSDLPELKNFILPGGSMAGAWFHVCRSVCRRAERNLVSVLNMDIVINPSIIIYLNRLSDFFFVLARTEAKLSGILESVWKPE